MIQTQFMHDSIHEAKSIRCAMSQNENKLLRDDMEYPYLCIYACVQNYLTGMDFSISANKFYVHGKLYLEETFFGAIQINGAKDEFKFIECVCVCVIIWLNTFITLWFISRYFGRIVVGSLFLYSIDRNAVDLFFDA